MRGGDKRTGELFSYADLEKRVGSGHPIRAIRGLVRGADRAGARILCALCADWAAVDAAGEAAPSDAVAGVLFDPVGTAADGAAGLRSPIPLVRRNRGRCCRVGPFGVLKEPRPKLEGNIAARFLAAVLDQPRVKKLLSTDHFTVDGTLIEAWASSKSFKPRDGSDEPPAGGGRNTEADFHGKKRSNESASIDDRCPMHGSTARDQARKPSSASSAQIPKIEKCLRHKGFRRVPGKVLQSVLQPSFLIPSSARQDRRSACRIALACRP